MNRRELFGSTAAMAAALTLPGVAAAQGAVFAPLPGAWRRFEVTTRIALSGAEGQAWVPLPSVDEAEWFRSLESTWSSNGATATLVRDPKYRAGMLHVVWSAGAAEPTVEVTSRIEARDRAVDLTQPREIAPLSPEARRLYLEATDFIPTDGIVKETSDRITAGIAGELPRARAIYEWVVDNTFRNAATRGCGIGDIAAMLRTGNLGGKCADLNALYVGLARAAGLPARDVYGLRVAPSRFGYRSLGAGSEVVTRAQHCRAEVFLTGFGWVPVDPADVRKVALEEPPGNLALTDPKVVAARQALFGAWEGNWLAYNFAHDVALPGSSGAKVEFLMYPQGEVRGARLDCLEPDSFRYSITARDITA